MLINNNDAERLRRAFDVGLVTEKNISRLRKTSHWMWYFSPYIIGLGHSTTAQYYSIKNTEEAKAFLEASCLGANLREITTALLGLEGSDSVAIFGSVDSRKLKSSMTLFGAISEEGSIFQHVLNK